MDKKPHILITNDDSINAEGIEILARHTAKFARVTVLAPADQCSCMSQRITLHCKMELKKVDFPVEGVEAYSLDGTPADCVKVGLLYLLKNDRPDYIFSGMNHGFNIGFDTQYSGTIGAAMEGIMNDVPSAAFSSGYPLNLEIAELHLDDIISEILTSDIGKDEIWTVNFPRCATNEVRGIVRGTSIAPLQPFNHAVYEYLEDGKVFVEERGIPAPRETVPEGTDVAAAFDGYISIGKIAAKCL